jgi:MATE family multidrug resistance protein
LPDPDLRRRHLRLAVPIAISNLTVPVAGLVDAALLGHLDEIRHLAGVALASLVFDYLYWTFGFLRMATTGLTAQAVGRRDERAAHLVLARGLLLAGVIALAILLLRDVIESVGFGLLAGDAPMEASGRDYFRARIFGAPATLANFALMGFFIGREQAGRTLAMTLVGNGANIVLDWLFIYQLGMAAGGAGLATALSQGLMLCIGLGVLWRDRPSGLGIRAGLFEREAFRELIDLNRDILIRTLCLITAFAAFVNLSALHGGVVLAANALLMKLLDVAAYGIDGLAFATESLAGILHGEGNREGLADLLRFSLVRAAVVASAFIVAVVVAGPWMLGAMTSHADVVATAIVYRGWLCAALLFGAGAYIYDGFFIGLTQGPAMRNAMLISLALGFAPAAWAAWHWSSLPLLWLALTLFMLARVATLAWHQRSLLSAA